MKCNINNISIDYEIIGEGKPVIMLHGYYIDRRIMLGCMEPIFADKEGYKRIYLDLPGMGESESSESIKSTDDMLEIVLGFIEKMIPNENFLIMAQSYGCYLARGIIHKMQDRVDGMALLCPLIFAEAHKRHPEEAVILIKDEALLSRIPEEDAEDMNLSFVIQNQKIYERWLNEVMIDDEEVDEEFLSHLQQTGYGFSYDVDQLNKKYEQPVLILTGKQDSVVGYKDVWQILENYPRASFAVLDRAGHLLQIEQEDLFNLFVNEWLTRVNEF